MARAALHFWEEPPLSGNSGSGAVFFSYCPLRCVYCQNAHIATGNAGTQVDERRLAQICLELQAQNALNINFVTPTHYSLQIIEAVSHARAQGLDVPVVWNTSGYERTETIEALAETVDVYLADYKYANAKLSKRYSHAGDYSDVALAAIQKMIELVGEPQYDTYNGQQRMVKGVIVRHLVLPGAIENSIKAIDELWGQFGTSILYSIMNQYTPVISGADLAKYPELGNVVAVDDYERVLDHADFLGIDDYFWQEGPAAKESFIPAWDGTGV